MRTVSRTVPGRADRPLAGRSPTWSAHAAAVWSFAFAAMSFYWAAGGTVGSGTFGGTIDDALTNGWFVALVWFTGALKAAIGLLALALVRPWGARFPRRLLLLASTLVGGVLAGYALLQFGARALQALGVLATPAAMYSAAAWWHLLLWNPWFLAGGVLFLLAAWHGRARP